MNFDPMIRSWEDYLRVYPYSLQENSQFWDAVARRQITWRKDWSQVSASSFDTGVVRWYLDAELNVSENCLDRHVRSGRAKKNALIWVGNDLNEERIYTFEQLHDEVSRLAGALQIWGVKKGDRVAIYLPNIPELAMSVLACARLGAIHSVIFGGFSATSIRSRVEDCGARWIITANGTFRGNKWVDLKANVDEALSQGCETVQNVFVVPRHPEKKYPRTAKDVEWGDLLSGASSVQDPPVSHSSEDPLFILYTSGSTGKPKGVLHKMGGYLAYVSYTHDIVFQPREEDVYWCTADVGWITGHSYLIYGPLSNGTTTLMFEGIPTYPDPSRFWQIVEKYKVTIFYSAPTAIRILAGVGDEYVKKHSRESLRTLGTVGEPINPEAWRWYHKTVGQERCPIVDTWWQTETGGILISPLAGISPTRPGSASFPLPGIEPQILDDPGQEVGGAGSGSLVLRRSWPGQMSGVYGDSQGGSSRFFETYLSRFPGKYFTGDGANRDSEGFYWITGRTDDVIKVSGHRLGTAEIESACILHPDVTESAAVGIPDPTTGEALHVFVSLREGVVPSDQSVRDLVALVRKEVGPLATPQKLYWVPGLPKTRSGKIMRRILRKIATGDYEQLGDTSTLADPGVVDRIVASVRG